MTRSLRIAIDTRDLFFARTGTRTYLEELCRALPAATDLHQFQFMAPRRRLPTGDSAAHKMLGHAAFYWWKEIELPWRLWREKSDVVLCSDYVAPLFSTAHTIPVFHGANFWERPQDYNKLWRALLDILGLPAARRAAAVITVSEFSKERLTALTAIPPAKLHVVYEGPKSAAVFKMDCAQRDAILRRYGLEPGSFLLHVGVMEKRKNLVRLVQAYDRARNDLPAGFKLVLVGQAAPKRDMDDSIQIKALIAELGLEKEVLLTGYVADDELPAFYQGASSYVFPSQYEGFGLPILEAYANDLPLTAANSTAVPEIAGEGALFFDPQDTHDMAAQMTRIVNDEELRERLIVAGRARLADFSWDKSAREILAIMEGLQEI